MSAEAGWYPDPDGSAALRYWDGQDWTDHLYEQVGSAPAPSAEPPITGEVPVHHPAPLTNEYPPVVPDQDDSRGPWIWVLGGLAIAVIAVWVFVAVQLLDDDNETVAADRPTTTPASAVPPATSVPAPPPGDDGDAQADPEPPPPTSTAAPVPPGEGQRTATLLVDLARVRNAPRLSATNIDTIEGEIGSDITVIGEPINGWYEIRHPRVQGFLFGAFIAPASDGLTVLQTRTGEPAVLRNSSGAALAKTNDSGSFVLGVELNGGLWEVLLPDGGTAFVEDSEMRVRS